MPKIAFMGAGSTQFAKKLLGDIMLTPGLETSELALYDIDAARLGESRRVVETLNRRINQGRARVTAHLGVGRRRAALRGADYVVNAIQVTMFVRGRAIDFTIPRKYGLRQTIGDTLGIGGLFRALRTGPVMLDFARDIEAVCPGAWFLNYTNPMSILTGLLQRHTGVKTVGLCHSWQGCAWNLLRTVGMLDGVRRLRWTIAGINHMAWLLEIKDGDRDLYPEIKRRAERLNAEARRRRNPHENMIRLEIMRHFGYYPTESSHHHAEYHPYWIKRSYPAMIREFGIPLDAYPKRMAQQAREWAGVRRSLVMNPDLTHERTQEYASYIIEALEKDEPFQFGGAPFLFGGNVINRGLIPNLPPNACVEVPCSVDNNGIRGCYVGDLPEPCAALNRSAINMQLLATEAIVTRRRDAVYQAAMLDPHTGAELNPDDIRRMCDELIEAHGRLLPAYR